MEPSMDEEYSFYWETKMFLENQELDSWGLEEAITAVCSGSSSPEGSATSSPTSPAAAKNILMERKRRRVMNEKLYALRSLVPNITRMDKASILKDAIQYIQELQEQERRMAAEVAGTEDRKPETCTLDADVTRTWKKTRRTGGFGPPPPSPPVELTEINVRMVGDMLWSVSIACSKNKGTMAKLCEAFRSLSLRTIGASITSFSGRLLHTLIVEGDDGGEEELKEKIETAIAEIDWLPSHIEVDPRN